jgi:tetratricopeptide (TPR) repeat protein
MWLGKKNLQFVNQLCLAVSLSTASFFALADAGADAFGKGIKAFKQQNYSQALSAFESARANGYQQAQLSYNLGVTYYKLGDYFAAETEFKKLLGHPTLSAIAKYNLALVYNKLNDEEMTLHYLQLAANDTSNPKIAAVAQNTLNPASPKAAAPAQKKAKKIWSIYLSEEIGHSDNVTLVGQDDATSEQGDTFLQTYIKGKIKIPGTVNISLSVFDISYDTLAAQDFRVLKLGIDRRFKWDGWKITPGINFSSSELSDDHFQDVFDVNLKVKKRFGNQAVAFRYRYSDIDAVSLFNQLDGHRHRIRADYTFPILGNDLRTRYKYETNDRKNQANKSSSPDRHSLELRLRREFTGDISAYTEVAFRNSDYSEAAGFNREDERYQYAVGGTYKISKSWSLNAKYQYTENDSNLLGSDYDSNVWQVGVAGTF